MDATSFKISYDGPALDTHEMDVKELAPALLAVGELLEEANHLFYGNESKIAVNIKAFSEGSFGVDFNFIQTTVESLFAALSSSGTNAGVNLITIVGFLKTSSDSVIEFIKRLRGRKIRNITKIEVGRVRIELEEDDEVLEVPENIIKLFGNLKVRKSLELIIKKPLEREGVDAIAFSGRGEKEVITKEESIYFAAPDIGEALISENEYETKLQIVSVSFREDNKWRFYDGNSTFFATILDEVFLNKIATNEEYFAKDDILSAVLLVRQYSTSEGIRAEYFVKKVIGHTKAGRQIPLPFTE